MPSGLSPIPGLWPSASITSPPARRIVEGYCPGAIPLKRARNAVFQVDR
jgi:hypothetical protein